MARYFLHLRDGSDELLDPDGMELADMDAVRDPVLTSARDTIAGDVHQGNLDFGYRIEAEDDSGRVVHTLHFKDAVRIVRGAGI